MWVESLDVTGFKRLSGSFEFDRRLTVVVGLNEAGKSSLGEAFMRSIWGFDAADRRKRAEVSRWERCRPWGGGAWRLTATLVDHAGRRLRAEWDFSVPELRLLDAVTGEDLTTTVAGKRNDYRLGSRLTGVSMKDFAEVCCFNQHTLAGVQRSDSLINALQRAVENVESDVGIAEADRRLCDSLRLEVGARSDSYNLTPSGPLQRAHNRRDRIEETLEHAELAASELTALAKDLQHKEMQLVVMEEERLELEGGTVLLELREAEALQGEVARQQRLLHEDQAEPAVIDESMVARARNLIGAVERAEVAIADSRRHAEASRAERGQLEDRAAQLQQRLAPSPSDGFVDSTAEREIHERLSALRHETDRTLPVAPEPPDRHPQLERYRQARSELLNLAAKAQVRWDSTRIAAAAAISLVAVLVGVTAHPAGLTGVLVAAVLIATARVVETGAAVTERLQRDFAGATLDDLERRCRQEDAEMARVAAEREAATTAAAHRAHRLRELDAALAVALDAAGAAAGESASVRAEAYLAACTQAQATQAARLDLAQVSQRLAVLEAPERDATARTQERDSSLDELRAVAQRLGIESGPVPAIREALDALERRHRVAAARRAETAGAQQALASLLADRSPADVEAALVEARRRYDAHVAAHGQPPEPEGDLAAVRVRHTHVIRRINDAAAAATYLQATIEEREARVPDVPQLREELADLERQIEDRGIVLEALKVARAALKEAGRQAHRNFAPALQRALQRSLPTFTAQRYRDVAIADDLSISVIAPETGTQVAADCLSLGTQDQIYLVQRLEIAKMLISTSGPVPLLLDEPFAEFDDEREESAVTLLCQEARHRQVVVFTKDDRLLERIAGVHGELHVIELAAPATGLVPA